jgi:hypothetical protein
MSYDEIVKAKQAKKDEAAEFKKFQAEKKQKKETTDGVQKIEEEKKVLADKPKSKGRPKKVE